MNLELAGKTVVITGASKGIGLSCADVFAAEGAARIIMIARDLQTLQAAAAEIRSHHASHVDVMSADLSKPEERERVWKTQADADILVNNAGAIPAGGLLDLSMSDWTDAWSLKVMGYIHLTRLAVETMKAKGAGSIVNIIGMGGRAPRYGYICGGTGNAALMAFTSAVGGKTQEWGVRVLGINPSATRTDRIFSLMKQRAAASFGDSERWPEMLSNPPLGRLAEPAEIARAAAFLASPAGGYVSGAILDIDGGGAFRGA